MKGSTSTAAVYYIHDDHLGGSSVISDANANVAQVLEYYPFGGTRLDQRPDNTFNEQRRSDGHEFDTGTGLLYEDARYLGPTLSRFLSEDPNFISAGAPDWVTGMPADPNNAALSGFVKTKSINYLANPQNLNSYSYVNENPLKYTDPDGKCPWCLGAIAGGLLNGGYEYINQYDRTHSIFLDRQGWEVVGGKAALGAFAGGLAAGGQILAASEILTVGNIGVEQSVEPASTALGSRYGVAAGEGGTLTFTEFAADRVLNPVLKKVQPQLYDQVRTEFTSGLDFSIKSFSYGLGGGPVNVGNVTYGSASSPRSAPFSSGGGGSSGGGVSISIANILRAIQGVIAAFSLKR